MFNKSLFSSKTDLWSTPQSLFDKLNAEFNFSLDVCAIAENAKCEKFFTPVDDGLLQEWQGVCWCNPPYGSEIGKWVKKAYESKSTVVLLLPARTDTRWFHEYIYGKAEIRFIKGRLKFGDGKNSAPFPSMVVVMRKEMDKQKKIEEMARHLCLSWKNIYDHCDLCAEKLCCSYLEVSDVLMELGYRKIF